jgi:hypothetical protein
MAETPANKPGPAACWAPCSSARILLARRLAKLGQPGGGRPLIGLGPGADDARVQRGKDSAGAFKVESAETTSAGMISFVPAH